MPLTSVPRTIHIAPDILPRNMLKFRAWCGHMCTGLGRTPCVEMEQKDAATCNDCRAAVGLGPASPPVMLPSIGMELRIDGNPVFVAIVDYESRRFGTPDGGSYRWYAGRPEGFEVVSDNWRVGAPIIDLTRGRG